MYLTRIIIFSLLISFSLDAGAQKQPRKKQAAEELNKFDHKGRRTGMWLNMHGEDKGEQAYTEVGSYLQGVKNGLWYKMDKAGDMVAIENFRRGVLDGEVKYFSNGQVTVIGRYRGLNPNLEIDTIMVVDPVSGKQDLVPVKADMGSVKHGTWRYYNEETGAISRVEEYQVDNLIYEEDFVYSREDSLRMMQRMKNLPDPNTPRDPKNRKVHSYLTY